MRAKYIFTLLFSLLILASAKAQDLNTKIVADLKPASDVVTFSPDGQLMATAGWGGVRIYKFNNANPILITTLKDHRSRVFSVSFSADGKYLATISFGIVKVFSVSNGSFSLIKSLDDISDDVESVSFSPDGKYLATGGIDGTIIYEIIEN